MDTFSPAKNPSTNGTQVQLQPRLITTTFGDGYKQSAPDGLNAGPLTPTLVWASIDATDGLAIVAFMQAHIGQTFFYTLPTTTTVLKYQFTNMTYAYLSSTVMTITVALEQRFDLTS